MNYDPYISSHSPIFKTPKKYIEQKLKILKRDFRITPTEAEVAHLNTLTTQITIDNAVLSIIEHHWDR